MQGVTAMSEAADFPRDDPKLWDELTANFGPESTVYLINGSIWCYSASDIEQIFAVGEFEVEGSTADDDLLPAWGPWVIAVGAPRVGSVSTKCPNS